MILSHELIRFIEIGLFCVFLFIVIILREIKTRKTQFLSKTIQKTWTTKRVYVDEERGGENLFGGKNWFVDPIENRRIYYDRINCFNNGHTAPAHVETILDVRTDKIRKTRTAYISYAAYRKKVNENFKKV